MRRGQGSGDSPTPSGSSRRSSGSPATCVWSRKLRTEWRIRARAHPPGKGTTGTARRVRQVGMAADNPPRLGGHNRRASLYGEPVSRGRTLRRLAATCAISATAVALVLVVVAGGSAAPPPGVGKPDRAAVIAYWSADRVAHAVPREVAPDRLPSFASGRPDAQVGKPGGGGGGGAGGSTATVTGAAWTGAGKVKATTGKVLFTMDNVDYVCSGSVATTEMRLRIRSNARSLVLTAGHPYSTKAGTGFATN